MTFRPGEFVVSSMDHDVARDPIARAEMTAATMKKLQSDGMTMAGTDKRPDLLVVAVTPGGGSEAARTIFDALSPDEVGASADPARAESEPTRSLS